MSQANSNRRLSSSDLPSIERGVVRETQAPESHNPAATHAPRKTQTLSRDEVAAVHLRREYYVNDVPSPYLSQKQADESIETTRRRHMTISTILVLILICAMVATAGWYVWITLKPEDKVAVPTFTTATITRTEFVDSIDAMSVVLPIDERAVTSEVSGTLLESHVEDGMFVEEGDVLFQLDNPSVTETLAQAQKALDAAQSTVDKKTKALEDAKKALENAQRRSDSSSGSTSSSSSSSRTTDDDDDDATGTGSTSTSSSSATKAAEAKVTAAQREVDETTKTLDSIRETRDSAQEQVDRLTVYAPISGTVTDVSNFANPSSALGGSERLCTVSDLSAYLVQEDIPEERLDQVHEGMEVWLNFPSVSDLSIVAEVTSIDEIEDGSVHYANIVIDNNDERLTKNLTCNASIVVQHLFDVLVVPIEAVHTTPEGDTQVHVLLDPSRGIETFVHVNVVATNATQAVIESNNIQEGISVILDPPEPEPAPEPEQQPAPEAEEAPAEEAQPEGEGEAPRPQEGDGQAPPQEEA